MLAAEEQRHGRIRDDRCHHAGGDEGVRGAVNQTQQNEKSEFQIQAVRCSCGGRDCDRRGNQVADQAVDDRHHSWC